MPHRQSWLIENQIVYVIFTGDMSSEDVGEAFHDSAQHVIQSTDTPVHFFHNWGGVTKFPTSLSQVFKASRNTKAPIRKVGWVIAYGKNTKLFKFMGNIFFQLFSVRFRLFKTEEEAIDFLCEQDTRLDKEALIQEKAKHDSKEAVNH